MTVFAYDSDNHRSHASERSNVVYYTGRTLVESIVLSPSNPIIYVGKSFYLGKTIIPEDAFYKDINWQSSNEDVISVDSSGKITGLSIGSSDISASVGKAHGTITANVYDISTNIEDETYQDEVTDTAGDIIDEIGNNDDPEIDNTDVNPDDIGEIRADIHEGIERNDTFRSDIVLSKRDWAHFKKYINEIERLIANGEFAGGFDISVEIYHQDGNGNKYHIANITQFENEIGFTIEADAFEENAPGQLKDLRMIRIHDGKVEVVPVTINPDGSVTGKSKLFSEFLFMYVPDLDGAKDDAIAEVNGYDSDDYVEEDRQKVSDAKAAALSEIVKAETTEDVETAMTAFRTAIEGCKTKSQQAAEALAAAKTNAKADLVTLLGSKKEADYDADDWTTLTTAIENGKSVIDSAETVETVAEAKNAAVTTVNGIKTTAEKAAEALATAKTTAKADLDTLLGSKTEADYDADDWTTLTAAITNGKSAIDNAVTVEAVSEAKNAAVTTVNGIKTTAEKAAEALATAKTTAKADLDTLLGSKTEADYDADDWTTLTAAITNGKSAIDNAVTVEAVSEAKNAAVTTVNGIKTKAEKAAEKPNNTVEAPPTISSSEPPIPETVVTPMEIPSVVEEPITIPKTPAAVRVTTKKNKATITWKKLKVTKKTKKQLGKIKAVQIQYSSDPNFKDNVITKKLGKNKTKVAINIPKGTTMYIRLRYVGADGVSRWAGPKRVRTK